MDKAREAAMVDERGACLLVERRIRKAAATMVVSIFCVYVEKVDECVRNI